MFWGNARVNWSNEGFGVESWGNEGLDLGDSWGNRQVGSGDTEAKTIGNVVDSLDKTVGVGVAVGSSYSTVGISYLLLGGVRVSITEGKVSKFILRLELVSQGDSCPC